MDIGLLTLVPDGSPTRSHPTLVSVHTSGFLFFSLITRPFSLFSVLSSQPPSAKYLSLSLEPSFHIVHIHTSLQWLLHCAYLRP